MFKKYIERKVKLYCENYIEFLFCEDKSLETRFDFGSVDIRYTVKGNLNNGIAAIARDTTIETQTEIIKDVIRGEKFIDDIVERILKKQVK